jgi:hypothetical protein
MARSFLRRLSLLRRLPFHRPRNSLRTSCTAALSLARILCLRREHSRSPDSTATELAARRRSTTDARAFVLVPKDEASFLKIVGRHFNGNPIATGLSLRRARRSGQPMQIGSSNGARAALAASKRKGPRAAGRMTTSRVTWAVNDTVKSEPVAVTLLRSHKMIYLAKMCSFQDAELPACPCKRVRRKLGLRGQTLEI